MIVDVTGPWWEEENRLSSRLSRAAWRGVRNEDVQTGKLHAHSMVVLLQVAGMCCGGSLGGMRSSVSYGSWAPGAGKGCRKALPDCVYIRCAASLRLHLHGEREREGSHKW